MRVFSLLVLGFTVNVFLGCAMTHPGEISESDQKELVLSANNNGDLSDSFYMFIEFTIENASDQWKSVKLSALDLNNKPSEILTGDKLSSWIEGAELKLKKAQYNTGLILGSMAAVGGAVALSSGDSSTQKAGVAVAAGAAVGAARVSMANQQQRANTGQPGLNNTVLVPKTHILAPFQVAPRSYVRRWLVMAVPKKEEAVSSQNGFYRHIINAKLMTRVQKNSPKEVSFNAPVSLYYRR